MKKGVYLLVSAQFVSGLADNALLIVTIARLIELQAAAWLAPALKLFFTLSYVLLAPFVGALADRWAKAHVMFWANLLKGAACLAILLGLHPLAAFAVAGFGAACYSPAKYGLITELVPAQDLVRANGWLEVSTVCAIILGTGLGGVLVSDGFTAWQALDFLDSVSVLPSELAPALLAVLLLYLMAGALNMMIPGSGAEPVRTPWRAGVLIDRFWHANTTLWRDRLGGLSLAVTTMFWGAGATLQFVVLAWAQQSMGLSLDQAAYLQVVVAVGITAGAAAAGKWVSLPRAPRVLPLGVVMGLSVPLLALVDTLWLAVPLLVLVGALAGFFVVPMNALLQHRGYVLLRSGESIAVQNFNENLSVLVMLGAYSTLLAVNLPVNALIFALGLLVAGCTGFVALRHQRQRLIPSTPKP